MNKFTLILPIFSSSDFIDSPKKCLKILTGKNNLVSSASFRYKRKVKKSTRLRGKLCFTQFSTEIAGSNLFHLFTQSIKFYTFHYHILKSTDTRKR